MNFFLIFIRAHSLLGTSKKLSKK